MRTTLTLEDDVAVMVQRARKRMDATLKEVVNEALRRGLRDMEAPTRPEPTPFRTQSVDVGECLLPSIDCLGETLAAAEGEWYL